MVDTYIQEIKDKEKTMARYISKIKSFQPEKKELVMKLSQAQRSIETRDEKNTKLMKENAKLYNKIYELEQKNS